MLDESVRKIKQSRATEADIISSFCRGTSSPGLDERRKQADSYRTGRALNGHIKDAHNGVEDPNCNACKEIKARCGL